jgi:transcriptional regulator with XRE-family HTH domain
MKEDGGTVTSVGTRIREARMKKGISQMELSRKTGIAQSEISRIEAGRRQVTDRNKQILADVLDEDILHLFFPKM